MRARYYRPRLMRFVNADPIKFDGGMNWYAYCGDNPVDNTEPSGQYLSPIHFAATLISEVGQGHILSAPFVAWESVYVDFRPGSQGRDAQFTNMHAMAGWDSSLGRYQTADEAYQGTLRTFRNDYNASANPNNGFLARSKALGDAYHVVQDSYAKGHSYQIWTGGFGGFANAVFHISHDILISPFEFLRVIIASFHVRSGEGLAKPPLSGSTDGGTGTAANGRK